MWLRPDAPAVRDGYSFWSTPDEVAARAVEGLRRKAGFIVGNPGQKPLAEVYFSRILAAYDS